MIVRDGTKFVEHFSSIIDKSTPHLYLSALPFAPSQSTMPGCLFNRKFPGIAKVVVGHHYDWPRSQKVLRGHNAAVHTVAFSPDGRHIVSGSDDRTIQVWDTQTGVQVGNSLQGHTHGVNSVAFSPDGRHIVSGSYDRTIQVWDAQTGVQLGHPLQESPTEQAMSVPSIHFSSSSAHALQDSQGNFVDVSIIDEDCRNLVCLKDDGWIVGPNRRLLLWVPPQYRSFYFYTPWTNMIIPRGGPELDLSKMVHGPTWHECYTSVPLAT